MNSLRRFFGLFVAAIAAPVLTLGYSSGGFLTNNEVENKEEIEVFKVNSDEPPVEINRSGNTGKNRQKSNKGSKSAQSTKPKGKDSKPKKSQETPAKKPVSETKTPSKNTGGSQVQEESYRAYNHPRYTNY